MYFWRGNDMVAHKLRVYDAVIRSKLMYGLESIAMNKNVFNRMDAFQMRIFRKVLNELTTFVDREKDNAYIMRTVNEKVSGELGRDFEIKRMSQWHKERRKLLLAKLIAKKEVGPGARAAFDPDTLRPYVLGK